jgi:putative acetyltransferase
LGGPRGVDAWHRDRQATETFVAEVAGRVVGFSDLAENGYVDRLFVDPEFGRRGIGTALLDHVRRRAIERGIPRLSTHASLVARPVFEAAGFEVIDRETVRRGGTELDRFLMATTASGPSSTRVGLTSSTS